MGHRPVTALIYLQLRITCTFLLPRVDGARLLLVTVHIHPTFPVLTGYSQPVRLRSVARIT